MQINTTKIPANIFLAVIVILHMLVSYENELIQVVVYITSGIH